MPDLADDRAAYLDSMRRAEEASGIVRDEDGNELNGIEAYVSGEPPVATPELEGAVPVSASDRPLTPEPEATEPVVEVTSEQQQQEAPAAELTVEELQTKLAATEARLAEKDSFIGRQSSEVGELRQAITEMQTQLATMPQQVTQPAPVIQITQELIESNPAAAVQAAFEQRNEQALHMAFEVWKVIDPFNSSTWLADRKLEQQSQEFEARIAAVNKQIETATAPLQEGVADRQWKDAFDEVKATRPDFLENAERILTEVAPQYPSFLPALQNGDAKTKAEALAALYALDKMGNPAAVQQQLEEAAQEAAAEAAAARAAAGVVVGQPNAGQPAEQTTEEQQEQERYAQRQRSKPSLARGWTGRS